MLINQAFPNGVAELNLKNILVEDEGCPHIYLFINSPLDLTQPLPLNEIKLLNVEAKIFITGADQFAIDGSFIDLKEFFDLIHLQNIMSEESAVDAYFSEFSAKFKINLFGAAEQYELNDSEESELYWNCLDKKSDIHQVTILNNATRAVVLFDSAMTEFKTFVMSLIQGESLT